MCGIVGYIGTEQAAPIILDGLSKLEYRGYDSAGMAIFDGEKINTRKAVGRLKVLENLTHGGENMKGTSGIGHTRWATHGAPSDINSHPHMNNAGTIAGHSIAHVLGAKYHIVHGEAVGYALPAVMEFVAPVRAHKVREIGQILGAVYPENAPDEQVAIIASRAFKDFRDRMLGLHPVEDYGISVEELVSNAQAVVDERFAGNTPRDIDLQAAEQLLEGFGSR